MAKKVKFKNKVCSKMSKCIKISGTGKLIRKRCGKNHMLDKKSNTRKRSLSKKLEVNKAVRKEVRKSLNL